jgi:rubrerythrin
LYHVERYIQDANKSGEKKTEKIWKTIRSDEEKHAELLHDLLAEEVKNNRF